MAVDYGEDFLQRIVGVHWRTPQPTTGGVFIVGDNDTNILYLRVGPGAKIDDKTGLPIWQNLGQLDFAPLNAGFVQGSSYALVGPNKPVFVLVGGGSSTNSIGLILASQDGLNWTKVFQIGEESISWQGSNIFAVVWDDTKKAFYAGGHQSDSYFDSPTEVGWQAETDLLFRSADGYSWSEAGRHETRIDYNSSTGWPPWPPYPRGLLADHCSNRVTDVHGNGLPDGFYKYDSLNKIMIAPTSVPKIDYFTGLVGFGLVGGSVTVTDYRINETKPPSNVGIPTRCVAQTGAVAGGRPADMGYWMAAGGRAKTTGDLEGSCEASILVPSVEEGGIGWKPLNPLGSEFICTIVGGQAKPPPI